jgi:uncharacterized membrane protein
VRRYYAIAVVLILAALVGGSEQRAAAQEAQPVVHAVLFYSPTCGHCQYVIGDVLPPLYQKYGSQLQIIGFDVTQAQGQAMFLSALQKFGVQQPSVPFLVIDDIHLVGSQEIEEQFPGLIDSYLALGGVTWPEIPGLQEMLVAAAQTATSQPPTQSLAATPAPERETPPIEPRALDWRERFALDATANTISLVVLVGMIASVIWGIVLFRGQRSLPITEGRTAWIIPVVSLLGLIVAGYLAYVEAAHTSAACGPIGDCNTVQHSPYARLFGVLSVGAAGLIGYLAMGAAWVLARFGRGRTIQFATVVLFLMALFGTLFSIYLTFLEPFVIGATCTWCLTSAVLTTALMLLSAGAAGNVLLRARSGTGSSEPRA